jgi:hypothetical protein
MRIVLALLHSIEEHDQVKLLTSLGYEVFSIGAYSDLKGDGMRPDLLKEGTLYPKLIEACHAKRVEHEGDNLQTPNGVVDPIDWAKADLPDELIEWMDVFIVHHAEHTFIPNNWTRLREAGVRVIWRTVGQSVENNERTMMPFRREGLEIIRYSPKEEHIPGYAGKDALIRFYADPQEWQGWQGDDPLVINITQNLYQRHPYTNYDFWNQATMDLPRMALGPGSEEIEGSGPLTYYEMQGWLRSARAYLYTGTQPASYTLGLIEALMTGIPVVSIGPKHMGIFEYGPELFEGHELAAQAFDDIASATSALRVLLNDQRLARAVSEAQRARAIETFGRERVAKAWRLYLGDPAKAVAA